jgi:pilus assembly protein CpaF
MPQPHGIDDHHGRFSLPAKTMREMIAGSVDVVDPGNASSRRFAPHHPHHRSGRHGRRRDHHPGPDVYEIVGEDANGKIIGQHRSTGIGRPNFWDRARYYGEDKRLAAALDAMEKMTS